MASSTSSSVDKENSTSNDYPAKATTTPIPISPTRLQFNLPEEVMNSPSSQQSPQKSRYADRFIPCRIGNSWSTSWPMESYDISEADNNTTPTKEANTTKNAKVRWSKNYQELLSNEVLGYFQSESTERREVIKESNQSNELTVKKSVVRRKLFHYDSFDRCSTPSSTFSLSPVSPKSEKFINSTGASNSRMQKPIPMSCYKVLDAPDMSSDFYLDLVDWSSQNEICVGLESTVFLKQMNPKSRDHVKLLCDLNEGFQGNELVSSVAWHCKGNLLAVGSNCGFVYIWDVTTGRKLWTLGSHNSRVGTIAWKDDLIATGSKDSKIYIRDIREPPRLLEKKLCGHGSEVCGLKWAPDSAHLHLASGGNDNVLNVWDVLQSQKVPLYKFTEHKAAVKAIGWSHTDHGVLASGGGLADRKLRFWNILTGINVHSVDTGSQVCNLHWSKSSSEFITSQGLPKNELLVWQYPSLERVELFGHSHRAVHLAMSPDGQDVVSGAGEPEGTLRFWKVFHNSIDKSRKGFKPKSLLNIYNDIR